jgi:hypothetical protein
LLGVLLSFIKNRKHHVDSPAYLIPHDFFSLYGIVVFNGINNRLMAIISSGTLFDENIAGSGIAKQAGKKIVFYQFLQFFVI